MSQVDTVTAKMIMDRIADLRRLSFEEVQKLPEYRDHNVTIDTHKCVLSEFVQTLPSGEILIAVRMSRPSLFGLSSLDAERGVIFSDDDGIRDATDKELIESGG